MTLSLLAFGFFLGLKHALEADHVAAVASLASRSSSLREHVVLAGCWGVGHAATLLACGAAIVGLGLTLPAAVVAGAEVAVGVMLIVLGSDVLRRLRRRQVHFHVHRHADGRAHFHAHAHAGDAVHDPAAHEHGHVHGLGLRALVVGGMHGLAGSAALVLLAAQTTRSVAHALAYCAVFGLGAILGMMALSLAISVPFRLSAHGLGRFQRALEGTLGTATIALGAWIALRTLIAP